MDPAASLIAVSSVLLIVVAAASLRPCRGDSGSSNEDDPPTPS